MALAAIPSACASTGSTVGAAATPIDPLPADATPPPPCLTIHDQELACSHRCAPLRPVVARCARSLVRAPDGPARYHFVVDVVSSGDGPVQDVRVLLLSDAHGGRKRVARGGGAAAAAACIRQVFRRYVPCQRTDKGIKFSIPIIVYPPVRR